MYLAVSSWVAKIASVHPVYLRKAVWLRCTTNAHRRVCVLNSEIFVGDFKKVVRRPQAGVVRSG